MCSRMKTPRRLVATLLLLSLTACHSWRPIGASPGQVISDQQPSTMRFTLPDGSRVTATNLAVRNDSIVGVVGSTTSVWLPADLRGLEIRSFSVGKTFGLILASAALVAAIGVISFYLSLEN